MDEVILVDQNDNAIGTMAKMEAHEKGILHRAFSVLLFNDQGELLLQQRARSKYHSAGLWTNTCCSHPRPGEDTDEAVRRRLLQEMGIDILPSFSYKFIYKMDVGDHLIEHEYDHVYIGTFNGKPNINTAEVEDWKFVGLSWLSSDMKKNPDNYTVWFRLIMNNPAIGELITRQTEKSF
jgi:isopentenyl-diphosphate delta-isomerase